MEKKRGQAKKNKEQKKIIKIIKSKQFLLSLLAIVLIGISSLFYTQWIVPNKEAKRPLSILLVGSDMNDYRSEHFDGTKPEKTDSLMVLTFNPNTYKFVMTSIPRDTSVDYICPSVTDEVGYEYQDQINELYWLSGSNMQCLEDTVTNFLNVPIDYYVKVNMQQFQSIIDEIGGIDIKVYAPDGSLSQANVDGTQNYYWTDGDEITMGSDEALTYARARHDSGKDYNRGLRQQQVIKATADKILSEGFSFSIIDNMLNLVDTNMPPKLIYSYYEFGKAAYTLQTSIKAGTPLTIDELPINVWNELFNSINFNGKLVADDKKDEKTMTDFNEYINKKVNKSKKDSYFIKQYQLDKNETYSGHYNANIDQLQEITDALRENLGLDKVTVQLPSYDYGDNYALGLMPKETTSSSGDSSSSGADTTSNPVQNDDTPIVESDSDSDGIVDSKDVCAGSNDNVDTDSDGVPDGCDSTPNGDPVKPTDSDSDGVVDDNDICPGFDDSVDSDSDGTPDGCDDTPDGDPVTPVDSDSDGVADDADVCPGFDDNVDTNSDGVPDGCDDTVDNDI